MAVSTHSRPKAAGRRRIRQQFAGCRFNTQPPEGGWDYAFWCANARPQFQHTAARRRLEVGRFAVKHEFFVSTHSRPKAAGFAPTQKICVVAVSTHSRPKAAGLWQENKAAILVVSTHSRPKAAGQQQCTTYPLTWVSTHSRPKAAGTEIVKLLKGGKVFQHTAARRRLGHLPDPGRALCARFNTQPPEGGWTAAKYRLMSHGCFNTQPPEGGWAPNQKTPKGQKMFQHTAARRRLEPIIPAGRRNRRFQHTAARRRLADERIPELVADLVSTHSRPKAAGKIVSQAHPCFRVSTHSRPKAAGRRRIRQQFAGCRFNTQPPEGGWCREANIK